MRDNDDFDDIPSMRVSRDDVESRQQARRRSDIDRPAPRRSSRSSVAKGTSWGVRVVLLLLVIALAAGAYLGYNAYQENSRLLEQANLRIMDLEDRLALVGENTEETALNIVERIDFNFSEIDKLWAARNATNSNVDDLTGRIATVENANTEQQGVIEETNQRVVQVGNLAEEASRDVATLSDEAENVSLRLSALDEQMQEMRGIAQELVNIRATLSTSESTSGGLNDRLVRVEQAVDAIDTYRLQLNQTVLRLQEQIDAIAQRQ